jgi:hypothetical protein
MPWRVEEHVGKLAVMAVVAIVFVVVFWKEIDAAGQSLFNLAGKLIATFILCVLVYQGYDGIRSGLTGTQGTTAKEVDDPTSPGNRFGGIVLGLMLWAIALAIACVLFDWDWPFRLLFGK